MSEKKKSNFEQMAENSRHMFLEYDKDLLAGKYGTAYDNEYLYITFLGDQFRIDRSTGFAAKKNALLSDWIPACAPETMIFYDIFCCGQTDAKAAAEYVNHNSLVLQLAAASNPGEGQYSSYVSLFAGNAEKLKAACARLGGIPLPKGDVCSELELFDFMKIRFQFWEEDDEFPASIVLYMDTNILKFMHFETTWYVSGRLLSRIGIEAGLM